MYYRLLNTKARNFYEYRRHDYFDFNFNNLLDVGIKQHTVSVGRGKYAKTYIELYCGFDIETYTTETNNGYMYCWQFSIGKNVIVGRNWNEFVEFIDRLIVHFNLSQNRRLLVFVANLSYEWQFVRKHFNITEYFFKDKRQCLKFTHENCIDFQECLSVSGGNLNYLAKTYCNTQKAVGDIDYTIPRNSKTLLTDEENVYICNDVLILSEWSQYYFDFYIKGACGVKCQPLTMQAAIRQDLKKGAFEWFESNGHNKKNFGKMVLSYYPQEKVYHHLMMWTFRGGYTHGNILHIDELLKPSEKIRSYDFTSSYPSCFYNYYPSRFHSVKLSVSEYYEEIKHKCVIAVVTFENIKATTCHSIESKSKCIELSADARIDNGRVRQANKMTVSITEIDFRIYERFYEWEKMTIHSSMVARRIKLPNYLLCDMEKAYTTKAIKKINGEKYDVEKSRLNSYYGVICTRLVEQSLLYDTETDEYDTTSADTYEAQAMKTVLIPTWSIYVTAWGRYNITSVLWAICKTSDSGKGEDALYIDTDSIKIKNYPKYEYIIDNYNYRMKSRNKKLCTKRGLDYSIFYDLGMLDFEGRIYYLKYLGAKRYLYTHFNSKVKKFEEVQTIAGLPKNIINTMYSDRFDKYNAFKDDMVAKGCKLCSYYNDEETSEYITDTQGNTALQTELSNVGLSPTDFTMTLDKMWIDYYIDYQSQFEYKEKRE